MRLIVAIVFVASLLPKCLTGQDQQEVDPVPVVSIVAGTKITGDGTRQSAFQFPVGSLGKLSIESKADQWILDDCPGDTEILETEKGIIFPTSDIGVYHVICVANGKAVHAWFEIRAGAGPPVADTISSRVSKAFNGQKTDAAKWVSMWKAVRDSLGQCEDTADVYTASETAAKSTQWTAGKYPELLIIVREMMPQEGTNEILTIDSRKKIESVLNEFIKGGEQVK